MKWIGQHIWDFISRFRSTVYFENLETSSETNVLVVDSDGKVTKNSAAAGDVTEVVAGNGLTGGGASGSVTVNVGVGTGLDVAADEVQLDLTEVIASDGSTSQSLSCSSQRIVSTSCLSSVQHSPSSYTEP